MSEPEEREYSTPVRKAPGPPSSPPPAPLSKVKKVAKLDTDTRAAARIGDVDEAWRELFASVGTQTHEDSHGQSFFRNATDSVRISEVQGMAGFRRNDNYRVHSHKIDISIPFFNSSRRRRLRPSSAYLTQIFPWSSAR